MKGCAAEGTRGLAAERVDNHDSRRLILVSRSSPTTRDERRQNPMVAGVLAAAAASAPTDYTRRGSRLVASWAPGLCRMWALACRHVPCTHLNGRDGLRSPREHAPCPRPLLG